jgi:beta-1,4-mannosyl-glycoprotein beta-1,4-N-acetylglucosaminyltransferase
MYFDEDMLLDLRLNILNSYVKRFIITEATYTHSGTKKKLNFDLSKFNKFKDKIEYIVVDTPPPDILPIDQNDTKEKKGEKLILNGYARDNYQRNNLNIGLKNIDDEDIIIISDLDEIPNLQGVNFKNIKEKINIFKQKMFYYKLNLYIEDFVWHGSKACKKKYFISPQWLRNIKSKKYSKWRIDLWMSKKKYINVNLINNGGWHFTSIRTPEELEKKLLNFGSHYEYEESGMDINNLRKLINEKVVMYDHKVDQKGNRWSAKTKLKKIANNFLPNYICENLNKYEKWLDNDKAKKL